MSSYDFVVIGSGPAGEKAAAQAAYFGKRVAVVERGERPGGAPVNRGGIPTKTLREAAVYLTGFHRREVYGVGLSLTSDDALVRLRSRAAEVSSLASDAVRANLALHGVDLVRGEASFASDGAVVVAEPDGGRRTLTADAVLIATGSRPLHPPSIPFEAPDVHDSDTILDLDRIPSSIVVIGGGPVGSEYASIFTALGVEVTLVDAADRLIPFLDAEISSRLAETFSRSGMRVETGSPGARIETGPTVTLGDGEVLHPEKVLFAAGRSGNTDGMGLDEVGVALDDRGRIVVDDRYETSVPGIFAAGDVIGPPALASVSAEQGRVAACYAFDIPFRRTVDPLPPYGIYAIPEVGMVGMTEEAARAAGIEHSVGRAEFAANARSQIAGVTEGLLKLVFDAADRRLLGVHVLGEEAAELVHLGQAAIGAGETIDRFVNATFNVPTRSEAYKYAAYDGLQRLAGRSTGAVAWRT